MRHDAGTNVKNGYTVLFHMKNMRYNMTQSDLMVLKHTWNNEYRIKMLAGVILHR